MRKSTRTTSWKKRGLCSMCGQRPPVIGGKTCGKCREYHREYRAKLRKRGMCKCGRRPVVGGRNCDLCRSKTREHNRVYRHKCIMAYGGYQCACCPETTPEFLQIDHVNNDGAAHRRKIGTGNAVYMWLIRNKFPKGFQVLCANCNYAKARYGRCPHQPDTEVQRGSRKRKTASVREAG